MTGESVWWGIWVNGELDKVIQWPVRLGQPHTGAFYCNRGPRSSDDKRVAQVTVEEST